MLALKTESELMSEVATRLRDHRLSLGFRQVDLSKRSGVAIATLRHFERSGQIGFAGLAKLLVSLGLVDEFLAALKPAQAAPSSLEAFVREDAVPLRKRAPRPRRKE